MMSNFKFRLRTSLLLCMLVVGSFFLSAAERDCLLLRLKSGEYVVFMLEDDPQIFVTNSGLEIGLRSFDLSDLQNYTFGDSENLPEGLSDFIVNEPAMLRDGVLIVKLKDNSNVVRIFTPVGQEINQCPSIQQDDKMMIDINGLPTGVYLINIGTETLKITKR